MVMWLIASMFRRDVFYFLFIISRGAIHFLLSCIWLQPHTILFNYHCATFNIAPSQMSNWWRRAIRGHLMCYHVYVIMHIKDHKLLSLVRSGHCVVAAGFCLSLYRLQLINIFLFVNLNHINVPVQHMQAI